MLRTARFDGNTRFFDYPIKELDRLIELLIDAEEVIDANSGEILEFDTNIWSLVLSVNVSQGDSILEGAPIVTIG